MLPLSHSDGPPYPRNDAAAGLIREGNPSTRATGRTRVHIDFVTTGLDIGGAERVLVRLAKELQERRHRIRVISLTDNGPNAGRLMEAGIDTLALGITPGTVLWGLVKLVRCLRNGRADLIQTWMYHANLLGTVANRFSGNIPLVWGIRQSNLHPKHSKTTTRMVVALGGMVSKQADSIVCCAESVRKVHAGLGYASEKMTVICNGVDTTEFMPMEHARGWLRNELGINRPDATIIGVIGRFDPQKDHRTFLRAARIFAAEVDNVHIVFCGAGMDRNNRKLAAWIASLYGGEHVHLLGVRTDIAKVIAGLDLLVSSASYGEGFPNVIAEAMACKTPVVGTDVGETRILVGDTGRIVEAEDPHVLAKAMLEVHWLDPRKKAASCDRARVRIENSYSVERMCSSYEDLYMKIVNRC